MMSIFRKNMWNMFREASTTSAKVFYEASKTSAVETARISAGAGLVLSATLIYTRLTSHSSGFFNDNTHPSPRNDDEPRNYIHPK